MQVDLVVYHNNKEVVRLGCKGALTIDVTAHEAYPSWFAMEDHEYGEVDNR